MSLKQELPRILVVDDKQQNRMLITEYLESLDVITEEAASGEACLELLEQNTYSLIILDVQMPDMDGFEVLDEMRSREETADIPVVLISAIFDSEEYIIKGIEKGAIDYLVKPINITILIRKVSNFLNLYEKQKKLDALVRELEIINNRLRENEQKFKRITNSANESIIVLNSEYQIRYWNKASKNYFGYSKYEIIYEDFFEKIIAPGSHAPLKEYFNSLFEEDSFSQISTIRLSGINKLGRQFPIELSLTYFKTANDEINYTVIIRDITRRARMEKDALIAKELHESNKLMKEFIDSVSHELRTPMNAILGISNMLLKYNTENLTKKQKEGLELINQSGSRLLDMINDILDLSRIDAKKETVNNEKFNLDKFLASLHSIVLGLIDGKKLKFHIRKSANLPENIVSDAKKLNQILTNILGNAVKFTHEGSIHLFIHKIEDKLYFEITDTGIGIAENHLATIFDRFKQIDNSVAKEYKGTGLGLNICKKLVELMGGEIRAESKVGAGTTMKFYVPVGEEEIPEETIEQNGGSKKDEPEEIRDIHAPLSIAIDDDQENLFWYANLLNSKGYETLQYKSARNGLNAIQKYIPDLILLKYEMPKIHGQTLINEIKKDSDLNGIPVLVNVSNEEITLQGLNERSRIIYEGEKENLLSKAVTEAGTYRSDPPVVERLVFYEKEDHL
ncbi:MAG: response regulator, partial [Bacteroidales bacterium]